MSLERSSLIDRCQPPEIKNLDNQQQKCKMTNCIASDFSESSVSVLGSCKRQAW